jgi:hypothetical protein
MAKLSFVVLVVVIYSFIRMVVPVNVNVPVNILTPLTLCPIDTAPIDFSMLTTKEVEWLNQYHKRVRETLLSHLSDEADKQWLIEATKEISC